MHYIIVFEAKKLNFFLKKMIHCRDENDIKIPKPIEEGDDIQFSILIGYM